MEYPPEDFGGIPRIFSGEEIFREAFGRAELATMSSREVEAYEMSLKRYRDYENTLNTAYGEGEAKGRLEGIREGIEKGIEKGRLEEKRETARKLKEEGVDAELISRITGLSADEIKKL